MNFTASMEIPWFLMQMSIYFHATQFKMLFSWISIQNNGAKLQLHVKTFPNAYSCMHECVWKTLSSSFLADVYFYRYIYNVYYTLMICNRIARRKAIAMAQAQFRTMCTSCPHFIWTGTLLPIFGAIFHSRKKPLEA